MHAGVPGTGAEDAWYGTALQLESLQMHDQPAVGTSIDIYKCFDQVIRLLVYAILLVSGFPTK
eukprot:467934-Karenia_brevis.AAC.1